jgi:predicted RNase H-like HicB family nuclease
MMFYMELTYTWWEADEGGYIGFINQYPDYWTQGDTMKELETMLKSLHHDIQTFDDIKQPVCEHIGTLLFATA